jgi:hypothetical protein
LVDATGRRVDANARALADGHDEASAPKADVGLGPERHEIDFGVLAESYLRPVREADLGERAVCGPDAVAGKHGHVDIARLRLGVLGALEAHLAFGKADVAVVIRIVLEGVVLRCGAACEHQPCDG